MPRTKHIATNSLFYCLRTLLNNLNKKLEKDIKDFINA
jgi:hypothetical protein